jgi:ATP phosphoribosyltransferase regulatory subunit HisZ
MTAAAAQGGVSLDLTGLNIPMLTTIGSGPLSFALGHLQIKRELIQAAAEIAQLLDAAQFANSTKINMVPKNSPERLKLINQAMENEAQLLLPLS